MLPNKHPDRLPPKNALVVKSNRLVEASYDLTLQQLKLIQWLSRVVQEEDDDYKYYDIDVPLFLQFMQLKGSNSARDRIREVTKKLQEKTILIRQPGSEEWEQFSWLRYSRVFKDDNRLVLRLSINPEMLPYIRDLREAFTKTTFYQITAFKSRYGWRVYEWCKQFESTGWLQITIKEVRSRLQIGETEYTRFNNLRQRVISPAIAEINRVSDLDVTLEQTIKRGRFVHALKFSIKRKAVHVMPSVQQTEPNRRTLILERLIEHGMPPEEAAKNVDRFFEVDEEHLLQCLGDLENKLAAKFEFEKTPLAWLRYILKHDQRQRPTLFTAGERNAQSTVVPPTPEEQTARKIRSDARNRIAHLETVREDTMSRYKVSRRAAINGALEALDETEYKAHARDEIATLEDFTRTLVTPETFWHHPLCQTHVNSYLSSQGQHIATYEEFCRSVGVDPNELDVEIEQCKALLG